MDKQQAIKTRRNINIHIKLNDEEFNALCELRSITGENITQTIVDALEIAILYKIGKIKQNIIGGGDENAKCT